MLFIDNKADEQVLRMDECIQVQEEAFRGLLSGDSTQRPRIDVYVPTERTDGNYRWGTMEGANKSLGVFATRMKSDIVYWPRDDQGNWTEEKYCTRPGLFCGLIFLFSTRDGTPLAIINDGFLQHMRVAGGAGIGAKLLAREDSQIVGMIGSGGMARTYLRAFCTVRDIRRVQVYSPTLAHREAYAAEMSRELDIEGLPVSDPQAAVSGADIVSTCTDAMGPVVKAEWLQPGMHVTCVGGAELGEDVYACADVVIRQERVGLHQLPGTGAHRAGPGPQSHCLRRRHGRGSIATSLAAVGACQPDALPHLPRSHQRESSGADPRRRDHRLPGAGQPGPPVRLGRLADLRASEGR